MKSSLTTAVCAALCAVLLVAGCAVGPQASAPQRAEALFWSGRLAVRIEAIAPDTEAHAFNAGFELSGSAQAGSLTLLTPIGSTAATIAWTPEAATLSANGTLRNFESLDALIRSTLGTEVPVLALFAWLQGENMRIAGWSADLSQRSKGRITARRQQPAPASELTLLLEP